jgi:Mrp family chromosome partitioning ATPase/capsular polysaccharide biosynthesis protein
LTKHGTEARTTGDNGSPWSEYESIQDYAVVLRRHWAVVAIATVVGIGAGLGLALAQSKVYTTTATLSFRDLAQEQALLGVDSDVSQPPAVRAAVDAQRVTRPAVTRRVADELQVSEEAARSAISTRVATQTQLVILEASGRDPQFVASVANSYARQARQVGIQESAARLERIRDSLLSEIQDLNSGPDANRPGIDATTSVVAEQLSRVQTLRAGSEPVEIVQAAGVPGSPTSPRPIRDGTIGGMIGFLFGLVAAFTRQALDRRLHTTRAVQTELGLPVLGGVRQSASGSNGLVAGSGSHRLSDADFETFRVLRTNLGFLADQRAGAVRTVLVTSPQPAEGKSTVSVGLASAAAVAGQRVLLLEGDLRDPSFGERLGVQPEPGLCDYLRGAAGPEEIVQTVELLPPRGSAPDSGGPDRTGGDRRTTQRSRPRLACITAGDHASDAGELLGGERFRSFLATTRSAYDLVVIDSPPMLLAADPLELVAQVDAVLLCIRAHSATRDSVRAARAALDNLPERPTCAVVTGLRADGPDGYRYYNA